MTKKPITLAAQIKKVIGYRILFCSIALMLIIVGLTIYDLSISVKQLRSRIDEQLKPIEDFAIDQAMINNLNTVDLKIESFNERNATFQIEWVRQGNPVHKSISWSFPFSWRYDYRIGQIAGFQFGYFKVRGCFFSDKNLVYDLGLRLILFFLFTFSVLSILYPLAKEIPQKLFINPINRFIDLISNNSIQTEDKDIVPIELEVLEGKILTLLTTATEHERNKAAIELGYLTARLAHDIHSPLAAMEMGLNLLTKKVPRQDLSILINGIQSVRDIANNVLERYRNPGLEKNISTDLLMNSDGNIVRPILLFPLVEMIIGQKRHEWFNQPCELLFTVQPQAKSFWICTAPNEIKRLLSNLLNNAYDALNNKKIGIIQVTLESKENEVILHIQDNGTGIPLEKITEVLNGVSLKHNGNGLGLSAAKQYMEKLSGKLNIYSEVNKGTKISLIFPKDDNLSWFPEYIPVAEHVALFIVLDDDFAMLMYWQQRLSELDLPIKLFSTLDQAMEWYEKNKILISSAIIFADFELAENDANGLMFLEKIGNQNNRYLITSHAEELYLQNAVEKAGVWLIPKCLVSEIEIRKSCNHSKMESSINGTNLRTNKSYAS